MSNSEGFLDGVFSCINQLNKTSEIVSGMCPSGPDYWAVRYSKYTEIELKSFPADWDSFGKSAGMRRNKQMADYADALLLIWDGKSRGSANMKQTMVKLNKPVYEIILNVIDKAEVKIDNDDLWKKM